jgi:LysR family glycine cleavage system transcriptional activator
MARRLPPLNGLRVFEAAARHLSFTRAAEELFVTQAAVSHQIKALEEWLGLRLFRRQNRRIILSDAGQAYLPEVREALDLLDGATRRLLNRGNSGPLTVSCLASFASSWLVPRLGRFRQEHPDIDIMISANDLMVDFSRDRDEVDIAIRYGNGNWPGLDVIPLMTEELFPVCSPDYQRTAPPLNEPDDLRLHTLLHDDMELNWAAWLKVNGVRGVDASRGPAFNLSNMLVEAAIAGQGVALARSALVGHHLDAGRLVTPFRVKLPATLAYYLVFPVGTGEEPKLKAFIAWTLDRAAEDRTLSEARAAAPQAAIIPSPAPDAGSAIK